MSPAEMKEIVQRKLEAYKEGMEKIGAILQARSPKLTVGCSHSSLHTNHLPCYCPQDHSATNFMIVCIAEFLSINESRRLLSELQRNRSLSLSLSRPLSRPLSL